MSTGSVSPAPAIVSQIPYCGRDSKGHGSCIAGGGPTPDQVDLSEMYDPAAEVSPAEEPDTLCNGNLAATGPVCGLIGHLVVTIVHARDAGLSEDRAARLPATLDFIKQTAPSGIVPIDGDKWMAYQTCFNEGTAKLRSSASFDPSSPEAGFMPLAETCRKRSGLYSQKKDTLAKCLIKKIYVSKATADELRKSVIKRWNCDSNPDLYPPYPLPPPDNDPNALEEIK
jgi:hypothetical protein